MQILAQLSYTRLKQIGVGQGLNSEVYLVDEPQLGGRVAVKEIKKSQFRNPAEYFDEAQTMFAVAHPCVVAIQYACQTHDLIILAMPYYRKGSLKDRISDRPLKLSEVLRMSQNVLAGLAHIHARGYVHLDLKPSNVLFSNTDQPLVADFGQSRTIVGGVATALRLYRPVLPPETIGTGAVTILSDIYQAGLLLYQAVNGHDFFARQIPVDPDVLKDRIARGKFPDREQFMPHVPKRLRTLIRKALNTDPARRFQSATEMDDYLNRVALDVDWLVEPLTPGGFRWKGARPNRADLVVELVDQSGSGSWSVRTFSERADQPRRTKHKSENWRSGLTLSDAYDHLEGVFQRLRQ